MQIKIASIKVCSNLDNEIFELPSFMIKCGDKVVVRTARGEEIGEVRYLKRLELNDDTVFENKIIRLATKKDFEQFKTNKEKAKEVVAITEELVKKNNLEMKIVDVIIPLDNQKILILFTSDSRVDFRELVKDLVENLKNRIELKQIGYRDEVKHIGGIGPCGRVCCCKTYNVAMDKVSMKMAKNQGLSLNPTKISGLCGRLMCCLEYENEHYAAMLSIMPKVNSVVKTPDGEGVVMYNNILKGLVTVKLKNDNETISEYGLSDLTFEK